MIRELETYDNHTDRVIGGFYHDGSKLHAETPEDASLAASEADLAGLSYHDPKLLDRLDGWGNGYVGVRRPGHPTAGRAMTPEQHAAVANAGRRARPR